MILQNDHCAENQRLGNIHFWPNCLFQPDCHASYVLSDILPYSQIAVCRVTWKQSLSFDTEEATLPATHTHPSLSSVVGAGKYILIFSPRSIFIDVAWLRIYFDDVHSVSFKLTNSLLFFCPSRILNGTFPYSFLSGIFHPVSLMKFILFSST